MGKCKTANKGGTNVQKGTSPFTLSEDVSSHPGTSPRKPFRFRATGRSLSEKLVSSEPQQDCSPTPKDQRHYCGKIRVMLGDRGGDQPPLPHAWEGGLIADILQEAWPGDHITKAMVLSPAEVSLFFSRHSKNKGLPYHKARGIEFGLGGLFNWARRVVQIEASRKAVQEGHHAILKAVVEKKTKARGLGQPNGKTRHHRTPDAACDIEGWM